MWEKWEERECRWGWGGSVGGRWGGRGSEIRGK